MADAKTSLLIEADGSQAKTELQGVSNAAKNLEKNIAKAAAGTSKSASSIAASAESAAKRAEAANARWIKSLERTAATYGKPKSAALEYQMSTRKLTSEQAEQAAKHIAAVKLMETSNDGLGMSAKQTANAMRLIPMQMTDIVTQLAGGQSPLLVLTQQGGQLKDVFGGIGPALRGVGSYVMALVNPFTVAAAAVAGLATVYQLGLRESERFNESLILTGGFVGKTSGQLSEMAKAIGDTVGSTGKAADVLDQLTATGKLSGAAIREIATAAVAMNDATGKAVDDTIAEFVKLGEAPSDAILKLNESQHFLTASIYEQIAALEEQGRKEDAAALAQRTYAAALTDRARDVQNNTGLMEKAWNLVAKAAKGAWDAMLDVGRDGGLQGALSAAEARLAQLQDGAFERGAPRRVAQVEAAKAEIADLKERIRLEQRIAQQQAEHSRIQTTAIAAQAAIAKQRESTASKTEQLNKALKDYRRNIEAIRKADPNSEFLDPAKIANDERNIRDKFKEAKGPAMRDDAATRMLMQLREQEAALYAQLETTGKLGLKTADLAKFEQQIADIKTKSILTADQKSLLANEDSLRAQLQKNSALEKEVKLKQESAKVDALRQALDAQLAVEQQQYAESLSIQGQGRRAQDELRAQQRIVRDYQRQLQQAGRDRLTGSIGEETYQSQIELLQSSLDQRLEAQRDYYAQLRSVESDWRVGASAALADYADYAGNIAQSAAGAFGNAFKGMEDALTNFVSTGKLSFADLADSIIKDMVRIAVQQSITGPLAGALGSLFGPAAAPAGVTPGVDWTYATGGYTGPGGKYDPAGIVHKGEYVLNQDATRRIGIGTLDRMNKGYSSGGLVGGGASSAGAAPNVKFNIINQGEPMQAQQKGGARFDGESWVIDVVMKKARTSGAFRNQLREAIA